MKLLYPLLVSAEDEQMVRVWWPSPNGCQHVRQYTDGAYALLQAINAEEIASIYPTDGRWSRYRFSDNAAAVAAYRQLTKLVRRLNWSQRIAHFVNVLRTIKARLVGW